jgi:hypothetical protein
MNDWLVALSDWLGTTWLNHIYQNVEWAVPATQTIHLLAIAAVFGSSVVLALRAFGLAGTDWSLARWNARLGGWIGMALVVLLLSGSLLIVSEPERSLFNTSFRLKMLLLLGAVTVLVPLSRRMTSHGTQEVPTTVTVQLLAAVLLGLWVAIIACGRWIAYS